MVNVLFTGSLCHPLAGGTAFFTELRCSVAIKFTSASSRPRFVQVTKCSLRPHLGLVLFKLLNVHFSLISASFSPHPLGLLILTQLQLIRRTDNQLDAKNSSQNEEAKMRKWGQYEAEWGQDGTHRKWLSYVIPRSQSDLDEAEYEAEMKLTWASSVPHFGLI